MADYSNSISNTSGTVETGKDDILKDEDTKISGNQQDRTTADCDVCLREKNKVIAKGYCVDCEEYLCAGCLSCHCRPKPCRDHVLQLLRDEMPKPSATCIIHPEDDVTHFCKTHDQLCCVLCISTGHNKCPDIKMIADEAKDIEQSEQLRKILRELSRIERTVTSRHKLAKKEAKKLSDTTQMAENAFNEELAKLSIPDKRKLDGVIEKCDTIGTELSSWKRRLHTFLEEKNPQQTFRFLHHTRKQLSCIDSEMQQPWCGCSFKQFRFEKVTEEIEGGKVIGKLISDTPAYAIFINKIKIRHATDEEESRLKDLAVLDYDYIVCADEPNSCLKVVKVGENSIQSKIALTKKPFQLARVSEDELFVSTSSQTIINVQNIKSLATQKFLEVQQPCWAIEWYENILNVVNADGGIASYGRNGKLLDVLKLKSKATIRWRYSTMGKDGSMYILCGGGCNVSKVQRNGERFPIVDTKELKFPSAIVYDDWNDELFVASGRGMCVFRVTSKGNLKEIISSLDFVPLSLAIDKQRRILNVGGDCDYIHQYKLY